jgi:hypothetical protein
MISWVRTWMGSRGACGAEDHILNPEALADLVEPRVKPLVEALAALGAEVFVSCAGHGHRAYKGEFCWPTICFRANAEFAESLARVLYRNSRLHYLWVLTGYFPPSYDFTVSYHLSVKSRTPYAAHHIDSDIQWLGNWLEIHHKTIAAAAHHGTAVAAPIMEARCSSRF